MTGLVQVQITYPDRDTARAAASDMIEARLVACVQLSAIESLYRWEGKVEAAEEIRLTAKTTAQRLDALRDHALSTHPYDEPQFIVFAISQASDGYSSWVNSETQE